MQTLFERIVNDFQIKYLDISNNLEITQNEITSIDAELNKNEVDKEKAVAQLDELDANKLILIAKRNELVNELNKIKENRDRFNETIQIFIKSEIESLFSLISDSKPPSPPPRPPPSFPKLLFRFILDEWVYCKIQYDKEQERKKQEQRKQEEEIHINRSYNQQVQYSYR
jgi:hypothetical protein